MAEQPHPCPHCQGTEVKIAPRWYSGDGVVLTCQNGDCLARIWGHDEADVVARWNRRDPASPPAPEQPAPSLWQCIICLELVRIGDDLRPYHLSGPANHEAELSEEDRKTLADRAGLTN
jgi:hypothetical protein